MAESGNSSPQAPANVPWSDVVRFVRQLSHDLRNHLNALELQSVFLKEIATDPEMKTEVHRLRETLAEVTAALQKLSTAMTDPKPNQIAYPASDLMQDVQKKFESEFPDRKALVTWNIRPTGSNLDVDPQLVQQAIFELLDNAFRFSPPGSSFSIETAPADKGYVISLQEPKPQFEGSTETWGQRPLAQLSHGHYGLGLNRVRAIVAAHQGEFGAAYDRSRQALVTTIVLPASPAKT